MTGQLEQTKLCKHCKLEKPLSEFWNRKDSRDGKSYACQDCCFLRLGKRLPTTPEEQEIVRKQRRYDRNHRLQHPERIRQHENRRMKYRYGITMDDFEKMKAEQNEVCYLCKGPPRQGQRLHIDHNHATGKVRKLLCGNCNQGLGSFKENVELLSRAIEYLKNHS